MKTFFGSLLAAVCAIALCVSPVLAGHCQVSSFNYGYNNGYNNNVNYSSYNYNAQPVNYAYPVVAVPIVAIPVQQTEIKVQVPVVSAPVVTTSPALANYSNPVVGFQLYALQQQQYNYNYGVGQYSFTMPYNSNLNLNLNLMQKHPQSAGPKSAPNTVVVQKIEFVQRGNQLFKVRRNNFGHIVQVERVVVKQRQNFQLQQHNFFTVQNIQQGNGDILRITQDAFGNVIRVERIQANRFSLQTKRLQLQIR